MGSDPCIDIKIDAAGVGEEDEVEDEAIAALALVNCVYWDSKLLTGPLLLLLVAPCAWNLFPVSSSALAARPRDCR